MSDEITLDRYVLDTLMRDLIGHDRRAAAYLVYLAIVAAAQERPAALSHQQLADRTGLSTRTVQDALAHLARRQLVAVDTDHAAALPDANGQVKAGDGACRSTDHRRTSRSWRLIRCRCDYRTRVKAGFAGLVNQASAVSHTHQPG